MAVADHTPPHLAYIAAPADAIHVGEWDDHDTGRWSRPHLAHGTTAVSFRGSDPDMLLAAASP